ncbi:unnamed protein product [Blepharisma stoltei]|uniref:Centrosomal protein of 162 kDa n=1 Tax=Blepharisma stoltei TaxID=1481888 RepID=A0AAU9IKS9_9CILI|nr:unnamed protein product [Blepharisma stoltei]
METSIEQDLEKYYKEHAIHKSAEISPSINNLRSDNKSLLIIRDLENKIQELEESNRFLRKKFNDSELKNNELSQSIALLEKGLKKSTLEAEKYKHELEYIQHNIQNPKENHKIEIEAETLKDELSHFKEKKNQQISVLIETCEKLQEELLAFKEKEKKFKLYKRKYLALESALNHLTIEKDKKIDHLQSKIKILKNKISFNTPYSERHSQKPRFRSKSPGTISPIRSSSPLTTSRTRASEMEGISSKILDLERAQLEYRKKLTSLLAEPSISRNEIEKLKYLLKQNDDKLQESKKIQAHILRDVLNY